MTYAYRGSVAPLEHGNGADVNAFEHTERGIMARLVYSQRGLMLVMCAQRA